MIRSTLLIICISICSSSLAQNVGINIASPNAQLHIHGNNQLLTSIRLSNNTVGSSTTDGMVVGIQYDPTTAANRYGTVYMHENLPLYFATNNTFRMAISGSGSVGIGTTDPNARLQIHSGTGVFAGTLYTNNNSGTELTDGMVVGLQYDQTVNNRYGIVMTPENIKLIFGTNGSFQAAIASNGNASFGGTVDEDARLSVRHNSGTNSPTLKLIETDGSDFARLEFNTLNSPRYWQVAGFNHSTTTSSDRFNIFLYTVGNLFSLTGTGNLTIAGTLSQNSDARLKTDIKQLDGSLNKIEQLNGYSYAWKNENRDQKIQLGLLAQEVQQIFPELVSSSENGDLSVNYLGLIPSLIESIKTLNLKIEEQQAEIDSLQIK